MTGAVSSVKDLQCPGSGPKVLGSRRAFRRESAGLVPVLAGLAVLGAWWRTRQRQGTDARAGLREGLAFLQRRAWALVPVAVLVVVAT